MNTLVAKVNQYQEWRGSLTQTISDYRDWLAKGELTDSIQELRGGRRDYLVWWLPRHQRFDDAGRIFLISDGDVYGLCADSQTVWFQ